jgi:hypothetical protein
MKDVRFKKGRDRRMLDRAGSVPNEAMLVPIFAAVKVSDYKDLGQGTIHETLMTGYMVCCLSVLIHALEGTAASERLEVVFEDQQRYADMARVAINHIAELPGIFAPMRAQQVGKLVFCCQEFYFASRAC